MNEIKLVVSVSRKMLKQPDTIFTVGKTNVLFTDNAENGTLNWIRALTR
jgi:hypothetical protein